MGGRRAIVMAGLVLALAGAGRPADALDIPSGVVALASADRSDAPCGGSAVLISSTGLALTLDEALPDAHPGEAQPDRRLDLITVILPGGSHRHAHVLARGSKTTAVLLQIDDLPRGELTPFLVADGTQVHVGDRAWSAGNSFGSLEFDGTTAVSRGSISGMYRIPADAPPVHGRGGRYLSDYRGDVLETDAAVNDGNQGGALIDNAGHLIGLVSLGTARERRLGTAVPIPLILADLNLQLALAPPARQVPADVAMARIATVVAHSEALVYFERPHGVGNPDDHVVPRPIHLPKDVPEEEREQLLEWWGAYYHQQQLFYTDQPVTALVIDAEAGLLLTAASNLHGGATRGEVLIPGQPSLSCTVVACNRPLDLCLLKASKPLPFSSVVLETEPELWPGMPLGLVARTRSNACSFTLTQGVVSASKRVLWPGAPRGLAQTDARANYGSLGGAVFSARQRVLGMVVMLGPSGQPQRWGINSGVALFVDSKALLTALPDLIQGQSIPNLSYIGLGEFSANETEHPTLQHVAAGIETLEAQDQIISIDGVLTPTVYAIIHQLMRHQAGDTLRVMLVRDKQQLTQSVVLPAITVSDP